MSDHDIDFLLEQWAASPRAFAECFRIKNKDRTEVDFRVSVPQQLALEALSNNQKLVFLKGRQMWITTICLVWQIRLCLFKPGAICAVGMQSDFNARQMSLTAYNLYKGNEILAELMPIDRQNDHQILFANGSQMLFVTANSAVLRSMPLNFAHLSEVRDYDDLGETLASIKVAPEGTLLLESTAGGEDDFYHIWNDPESAFQKVFFCWRDHKEYRALTGIDGPLQEIEKEYIKLHGLGRQEANWWVRERRALPLHKRPFMVQEHPTTPEEAFLLSGDKYLRRQVPTPVGDSKDADEAGIIVYHPYNPTHQYVVGIDPSPGSSEKGDPTGLVIIDLTDRCVVLTQEIRQPTRDFEGPCLELIKAFGSPLTVIETAAEGLGLCDFLRGAGVPMYHMTAFGGLSPTMLPRHGWRTDVQTRGILFGEIYEGASGNNRWHIGCHRLVKQLNALCYDKRGKPAAPKNGHDDLVIAFGLALIGVVQALPAKQAPEVQQQPKNALDAYMLDLERAMASGRNDWFDFSPDNQHSDFFE